MLNHSHRSWAKHAQEKCASSASPGGGPFIPAAALTKSFRRVVHHYYCSFNDLSDNHLRDVGDSLYLHELFEEDFPVFLSHSDGEHLLYEILNSDGESEYSETDLWARQSDDPERWELGEWLDHLLPVIEVHGHSYRRAKGSFGGEEGAHAGYNSLQQRLRESIIEFPSDTELWRARLGSGHTGRALGAPPPEVARAGRANLQGQPVLYLCGDRETASYEVRPSIGDVVSIGRFQLSKPVQICDLRRQWDILSPFVETAREFEAFKKAEKRREAKTYLGGMFAEPVRRDDEPKSYIPTQALAQMIAELPADGVAFTSSQRGQPGWNVLLFDPEIAHHIGELHEVKVTEIQFKFADRVQRR